MPLPEPTDLTPESTRHALIMSACMLAGPVVFLTVLSIVYSWASGLCQHVTLAGQLALSLVPAALTAALALVCRRELDGVRRASADDPSLSRARLVARVGLHLNVYSTLLLLGLCLPMLLLRPCE